MELIFILTYDCNFRCTYCDIDKRKQDMSSSVLHDSIAFLETQNFPIDKVKFFGGEPLLKKDYIKYVMEKFPDHYTSNFYVTSNSTLVDDSFINDTESQGLHITFSIDGDAATTSENRKTLSGVDLSDIIIKNTQKYSRYIRVNQVVTSQNSEDFFKNFMFLYDLGVRKFNFLPEYYREWSKQGLQNLMKGFQQISDFYKQGNDFYLVNSENYSKTAFFNLGVVIDTDGSIYGTNLILSGDFEKYKPDLKIGDIYSGIQKDFQNETFQKGYINIITKFIEAEYTKEVLLSVKYIDKILSNFVMQFEGAK